MARWLACAALLAACLSPPATAEAARGRPDLTWVLDPRPLGFSDWRQRIVLGRGEGWIGGSTEKQAGPGGLLYRWQDGDWQRVELGTPETRTFVLDLDGEGGLWLFPFSRDTAAYSSGLIRRFDGRRWHDQRRVPGFWPQAVDMVSATEGWVVGNRCQILHLAAGEWRDEVLELPPAARRDHHLLDIEMLGGHEGWAMGTRGLVAHYRAGRWRTMTLPELPEERRDPNLAAVEVAPDGSVWVAGTGGFLASFDGTRWRLFDAATHHDLMGLAVRSADEAWAVGAHGTILRFDGTAWRGVLSPTAAHLYDLAFDEAGRGWITGDGVLLYSTRQRGPALRDLSGVASLPMTREAGKAVAALDLDGDADLDLALLQPTGVRLFTNLGAAGFAEAAAPPAVPSPGGLPLLYSMAWGDTEGDGDLDLLAVAGEPLATFLYRNRGDGRFEAPEPLGLAPQGSPNDTATLLDLDRDGRLDLYWHASSRQGSARLPNYLYRGDGAGRFARHGGPTGEGGIEMLTLWGDLDGDLDLDAVLPGFGNEITLLENDGGLLTEATAGSGLDVPLPTGQMHQGLLADLDLDADLDLLMVGARLLVFVNDGAGRFRLDGSLFDELANNPAMPSRAAAAGDLDGDGYPEILLSSFLTGRRRTHLFARGDDGRYHDVAEATGLAHREAEGAVFADFDGDGDLDLFLAGERQSALLANERNDGAFLEVRPRGVDGDRMAVGARVSVYEAGHLGEQGFLRGHQQAGLGFQPTGIPAAGEVAFGIAAGRRYDVEVRFLSGRSVARRGVPAGAVLTVHERPAPMRQMVLAARRYQRGWRLANRPLELAKLGAVLAALALARGPLARRLGARTFAHRAWVAAALVTGYLLVAGLASGGRGPRAHAALLAGWSLAVVLVLWADRRVTAWRGARFLGPYRLMEPLGEGGMGVVHRARHVVSGREVALKVLHPRMTEQEDHRLRFLREARILTRLEHPRIVKVFETGEIAGRGYISMELLSGRSLAALLTERGPLAPERVAALLAAACGALAHVHAHGIVHRDLKADNLFVLEPEAALAGAPEELERRVRLMDFGLARALGTATVTGGQGLLGTLPYMAPELLAGEAPDRRSDLYALGVVAFEALTGRRPHEATGEPADERALLATIRAGEPPAPAALAPHAPPALCLLIERLLARSREARPASAEDLLASLEAVAAAPADEESASGESPSQGAAVIRFRAPGGPASPTPRASTEQGSPVLLSPAPGSATRLWQARFRAAQQELGSGRAVAAQVLLLDCLAELRRALAPLPEAESDRYCRRHDVAAVLELARRLNP